MEITNLSPIEEWLSDFEKEPLSALDNLLRGRAYLGKLNRNETSEILFRLFHTKEAGVQRALDNAMRDWFEKYWMASPPTATSSQWAEILQNAFTSVQRLHLRETYRWLSGSYFRGRSWLRSLYQGPARDPEAALLQTLALCQQDQTLLPLWMRICRMEEDLPLHYAAVGLLGLRKLPEKDGTPPGGLKPMVFEGIVDLAEAIDKRCKPHEKKQGEDFWLLECRAIMALYPLSTQCWINNFSPLIQQRPECVAAKWLNKIIPNLLDRMKSQQHNNARHCSASCNTASDVITTLGKCLDVLEISGVALRRLFIEPQYRRCLKEDDLGGDIDTQTDENKLDVTCSIEDNQNAKIFQKAYRKQLAS